MDKKMQFAFTYWFGNPPWDTGITPPELHQFLESNPPEGRWIWAAGQEPM